MVKARLVIFLLVLMSATSIAIAGGSISDGMLLTGQETLAKQQAMDAADAKAEIAMSPYIDDHAMMQAALEKEFDKVWPVKGTGNFILQTNGGTYNMINWQVKQILYGDPKGPFDAKFMRANNNPDCWIYITHHRDNKVDLYEEIRVEVLLKEGAEWVISFMGVNSPDIKADSSAFGKESVFESSGKGLSQWYGVVNYKAHEDKKVFSVYDYVYDVFFDTETRKYAIDNTQVAYEVQYNMGNLLSGKTQ